jgi:hypothetical protein
MQEFSLASTVRVYQSYISVFSCSRVRRYRPKDQKYLIKTLGLPYTQQKHGMSNSGNCGCNQHQPASGRC